MKVKLLTLIALAVLVISCKEEDPEPTAAEKQVLLLAGNKGQSKTWKLTTTKLSVNGAAPETVNFNPCFSDNLYEFSNNESQDYEITEGASKCNPGDPTVTEYGNWALTLEGKLIIFAAIELASENYSFGNLTCDVISITASELSISFDFEDTAGDNQDFTLTFSPR